MFVVLMINSIGTSMWDVVSAAYDELHYDADIRITGGKYGTDIEGIRKQIKKDRDIIASQEIYQSSAEVNGTWVPVEGVDPDKYASYNEYLRLNGPGYEAFKNGSKRCIIINERMARDFKLQIGDPVELEIDEVFETFQVTDIIDSRLYGEGYLVLAKIEALEDFFDIDKPSMIVCTLRGDAEAFKARLEEDMSKDGARIVTFETQRQNNLENNNGLIVILNLFSILAVMISALGVVNNISISFIQRKKSIVVLSSVGMTTGQRTKMLIAESVITTLCPVLVLCIAGSWSMKLTGNLITCLMDLEMPIQFDMSLMPKVFIMTLIMQLLATIPSILKNKRFKIVEELKYE